MQSITGHIAKQIREEGERRGESAQWGAVAEFVETIRTLSSVDTNNPNA